MGVIVESGGSPGEEPAEVTIVTRRRAPRDVTVIPTRPGDTIVMDEGEDAVVTSGGTLITSDDEVVVVR